MVERIPCRTRNQEGVVRAAAKFGFLIGLFAAAAAQAESRNGQPRYPELQGWENPHFQGREP